MSRNSLSGNGLLLEAKGRAAVGPVYRACRGIAMPSIDDLLAKAMPLTANLAFLHPPPWCS